MIRRLVCGLRGHRLRITWANGLGSRRCACGRYAVEWRPSGKPGRIERSLQ